MGDEREGWRSCLESDQQKPCKVESHARVSGQDSAQEPPPPGSLQVGASPGLWVRAVTILSAQAVLLAGSLLPRACP